MTTDELLLRRLTGRAAAEDHVAWAVERLAEGLDSPSLRILAGLDPVHDRDDVESYFRRSADELDEEVAPLDGTPREAAEVVRRLFDEGRLPADEVVQQMVELDRAAGHSDPLLRIWLDIDEELSLRGSGYEGVFYPPEALDPLDATVRTEWRLLEQADGLDLPDRFRELVRCEECDHIGLPRRKRAAIRGRLRRLTRRLLRRPLEVWFACARCGSEEYRGMSDPEVRADYFRRLAGRERTGP